MYNHPVAIRIEFIPNSRDLSESRLIYNYAKSRKKVRISTKTAKTKQNKSFSKGFVTENV